MTSSALVVASGDPRCRQAVAAAHRGLSARYTVETLDLTEFTPKMSEAEWSAYHSSDPIIDPVVRKHAELVIAATALVFVYPTTLWGPPPVLKAWLERVLVPGIAFVLDDGNRVRPNLKALKSIAGITVYDQSPDQIRVAGDGGKRIILRALRLNAPRRLRTAWLTTDNADDTKFLTSVETATRKL